MPQFPKSIFSTCTVICVCCCCCVFLEQISFTSGATTFPPMQLSFELIEEVANNTPVGDVKLTLQKKGYFKSRRMDQVQFHMVPPILAFLRIDRDSGILYTKSRVDREDICSSTQLSDLTFRCLVSFQVMLLNKKNSKESFTNPIEIVHINLRIFDLNDCIPQWSSSSIQIDIPENSPIDSFYHLPEAFDPDQPPKNTTVAYRLEPSSYNSEFDLEVSPQSSLSLDYKSQAIQQRFTILLKVKSPNLDREKFSHYSLRLLAMDGGTPSLTGTLTLNITITDINDNPPIIHFPQGSIIVKEDFPLYTRIAQFHAEDVDLSNENQLEFFIGWAEGASESNSVMPFFVNRSTGVLSLKQILDFEKQKKYDLSVSVSDGKYSSNLYVPVSVTNVNDCPPEITFQPLTFSTASPSSTTKSNEIIVKENLKPGFLIGGISVEDKDDLMNTPPSSFSPIVCQINDPTFKLQPMYQQGGQSHFKITTSVALDREKQGFYFPIIFCFDSGDPPLSSSLAFQVTVEDANDCIPQFSPTISKEIRITENQEPGLVVTTVTATDMDVGASGKINYSLDVSSQTYFSIDTWTGVMKTKMSFDREITSQFTIQVFATDGVVDTSKTSKTQMNMRNIANTSILVRIEDVNDCFPIFEQTLYYFTVKEGQRKNQVLDHLRVRDMDATPPNNVITFKMLPSSTVKSSKMLQPEMAPSDVFFINSDGAVSVITADLDREHIADYRFIVVAEDKGVPQRLSSSAVVQIHIEDVNDNAPIWHWPTATNRTVNITYREPVGHRVTQISAIDMDEDANGRVFYKIINSDNSIFQLDSESGFIYVAQSMNIQNMGIVKLFLEARDRGTPTSQYSTSVLEIRIVSDLPPADPLLSRHFGVDMILVSSMISVTILLALILAIIVSYARRYQCRKRSSPHDPDIYDPPSVTDVPGNVNLYEFEMSRQSHQRTPDCSATSWTDLPETYQSLIRNALLRQGRQKCPENMLTTSRRKVLSSSPQERCEARNFAKEYTNRACLSVLHHHLPNTDIAMRNSRPVTMTMENVPLNNYFTWSRTNCDTFHSSDKQENKNDVSVDDERRVDSADLFASDSPEFTVIQEPALDSRLAPVSPHKSLQYATLVKTTCPKNLALSHSHASISSELSSLTVTFV